MVKRKDFIKVAEELGYVKGYWKILGIIAIVLMVILSIESIILGITYEGSDASNAQYFRLSKNNLLIVDIVEPIELEE